MCIATSPLHCQLIKNWDTSAFLGDRMRSETKTAKTIKIWGKNVGFLNWGTKIVNKINRGSKV
jgi:hypothetical protein